MFIGSPANEVIGIGIPQNLPLIFRYKVGVLLEDSGNPVLKFPDIRHLVFKRNGSFFYVGFIDIQQFFCVFYFCCTEADI